MTNYCRNKQVNSTKIRISSWFLFFIRLSWTVPFYWMFPHLYDYFGVSMLRVFTWMGRVWGARDGGGAKSSLLPLTSLCVSSPTHTCSPHWISFPFSNKTPIFIFIFWDFLFLPPAVCGKRSKFSWWWDVEVSERTDQVGHITSFILFTTSFKAD